MTQGQVNYKNQKQHNCKNIKEKQTNKTEALTIQTPLPKAQSEDVNRRTDNTMTKSKRTNNDLQSIA